MTEHFVTKNQLSCHPKFLQTKGDISVHSNLVLVKLFRCKTEFCVDHFTGICPQTKSCFTHSTGQTLQVQDWVLCGPLYWDLPTDKKLFYTQCWSKFQVQDWVLCKVVQFHMLDWLKLLRAGLTSVWQLCWDPSTKITGKHWSRWCTNSPGVGAELFSEWKIKKES